MRKKVIVHRYRMDESFWRPVDVNVETTYYNVETLGVCQTKAFSAAAVDESL